MGICTSLCISSTYEQIKNTSYKRILYKIKKQNGLYTNFHTFCSDPKISNSAKVLANGQVQFDINLAIGQSGTNNPTYYSLKVPIDNFDISEKNILFIILDSIRKFLLKTHPLYYKRLFFPDDLIIIDQYMTRFTTEIHLVY